MKNVIVRSLSGIVYIALIVGGILLGGWWWYAVTGIFAVIAMTEFQRMTAVRTRTATPLWGSALDMASALLLWGVAPIIEHWSDALPALAVVLGLCLLVRMTLALAQHQGDAVGTMAQGVFSVLYVGIPMGLLNVTMLLCPFAVNALLWMFILIWLNDTGAFCVGSLFGRHRLCERLSPKKSWEGFWGGMFFCVAAAMIFGSILYGLNVWVCGAYGALVCVFATWGDLFESLLKRSASLKDSGDIIPGHGGILDRIDSLLFVAPASAIFYLFVV